MKITKFFKTEDAMLHYYHGDVANIPSSVLAIVGEEDEDRVLYTNSNNQSVSGKMSTEGGYVPSPEDEAKLADYDSAVAKSEDILGNENTNIPE